jgi:hypothetical protein
VDLLEAAMFGVPQATDQGDDVRTELVLGQGEASLLFGPQASPMAGAGRMAAASDLEPQQDQAVEGGDGASRLVRSRVRSKQSRTFHRGMGSLLEALMP